MTSANMKTLAGGMACESVRVDEPIVRKIIDIVIVVVNENSRNVKYAAGSRRRFVMK